MDFLNSDGSGALALEPLCQAAARELLMRSYTIRTLNRYKRVWEQLADFARAQGQPAVFSRDLALRFEEAFGLRDGEVLAEGHMGDVEQHVASSVHSITQSSRASRERPARQVRTAGLRIARRCQ